MIDNIKRVSFCVFILILVSGLSQFVFAEQIENGDFETGDYTDWTITGTAWGSGPTDSHPHVLGWQDTWFAETWKAGESTTGTLRSDTFELTGAVNFLIAGWNYWSGVNPEQSYNYVILRRASDDLELDRAWAPNQNTMVEASLEAPAYVGQTVYIEVVDDGAVAAYAWLAVDAFWVDNPAMASDPVPADSELELVTGDTTLSWTSGVGGVEHDVYLGTDYASVSNADTSDTTGIYRGRIGSNSYDPYGLTKVTYYWRIDEVDSGEGVTKGDVWHFVVERDLYSDTWVATDALGRELPGYEQCGEPRDDKYVGIFYLIWHGAHLPAGDQGPYNNTEYIAANPFTYPTNPWYDNPDFGALYTQYWAEPEAGYYLATDKWVIRRNLSMLADAGVDVLIMDTSNTVAFYLTELFAMCEVAKDIRLNGGQTPQFVLMTHAHSPQIITYYYDNFYSQDQYSELWFQWQGKPLILGYPDGIVSDDPRISVSQEIEDFFTWRESWAWDAGYHKWQWLDTSPQDYSWDGYLDKAESMPVAAASHPTTNIGRSHQNGVQPAFNEYHLPNAGTQGQGLYFAEQWQRILELDPEFVYISSWNEWVASVVYNTGTVSFLGLSVPNGGYFFIDAYNQEYSRDLAPMKGGHTDNYYYQMIDGIRRSKGVRLPRTTSKPKVISIDGSFGDWADVAPEFRDTIGDTFHRNHDGWGAAGPYVNTTGRNDLMDMKVARDNDYIYFYAKTRDDITSYENPGWMFLFIDADQNHSTGWEGYDYVINDTVNSSTSTTLRTTDSWGIELGQALAGHWKLDEASGSVASDSAGSNDGTVNGTGTWTTGEIDGALSFDGDDYVEADGLCADIAGSNFTLAAWMKSNSASTQQFIASFNTSTGDNRVLLGHPAGSANLQIFDGSYHDSGTVVVDDTWHHVAYTLDNANNILTVYVDGSDVDSFSSSVSILTSDLFTLGQEYDAGPVASDYYIGIIDDVRVYNRVLSETEILSLYNKEEFPIPPVVNGDILYSASGNQLELRVPRSDIGLTGEEVAFDFHWADNIQAPDDIIEFAVSGDSAPNRRFNYRYDTSVSTQACQKVFDDGNGNNMDLDEDCDIDIYDLELFTLDWLSPYDMIDYADLADDWLDDYMPAVLDANMLLDDDFETGDFSEYSWAHSGHQDWTVTTDNPYRGTYSAKSGNIIKNQQTYLSFDVTITSDSVLSFNYRVSSEPNYDWMYFKIDGDQKIKIAGDQPWTKAIYTLTPGTYTLEWSYTKDSSIDGYSDCVWIDNVKLIAP